MFEYNVFLRSDEADKLSSPPQSYLIGYELIFAHFYSVVYLTLNATLSLLLFKIHYLLMKIAKNIFLTIVGKTKSVNSQCERG